MAPTLGREPKDFTIVSEGPHCISLKGLYGLGSMAAKPTRRRTIRPAHALAQHEGSIA